MIFIVGLERYPNQCKVEIIDLDTGKYNMPRIFKDNDIIEYYVKCVYGLVCKLKPKQIIFDEFDKGLIFKEIFVKYFKQESRWNDFEISDNGKLLY